MKVRGCDVDVGIVLDALVESEDVQHFEVLALVLVHALDQHVEHGVGIDGDAEGLVDVGGEALLVVVLDGAPLLREVRDRRPEARGGAAFRGRESSRGRGAR